MRLPSRWFIAITAIVVAIAAVLANAVALRFESPAAGVSASIGRTLPAPRPNPLPSEERTQSFDVLTRVRPDGSVRVRETIVQDFGVVPRHGIERVIPLRDGLGEHRISDVTVSTSTGTPNGVSMNATSDTVTIRIGDADQTIAGVHRYRVVYDLDDITDSPSAGQARLAVDAISGWAQTIDTLRYQVIGPARPTTFKCQQGPPGSADPCASARRSRNGAAFRGNDLAPDDAFTVRMTWPDSVVAVSAEDSLVGNTDLVYALLAGLATLFVGWRYRRRWRRLLGAAQSQLWATFGPDVAGAQPESYDLRGDPAIEFVPPMGLRPGEVGTLVEANATLLLTATVVDLAARGAIKITESSGTWTLERRNPGVVLTDDEQTVVERLFRGADTAALDDRGAEMGTLAGELAELLTDDLEDRNLAVRGTSAGGLHGKTHVAWLAVIGIVAVMVGAIAHGVIVTISGNRTAALAIETVIVLGVILGAGAVVVAGAARGLTPLGIAAAWRVRGFDRFFTASEAVHDRAAADKGLFRQYMGYAIVFGHVSQWVAAFDEPDTSDWFASSRPLDFAFIGFASASLWSPPPSTSGSSSGFGGGGFGAGGGSGGGGGGSW